MRARAARITRESEQNPPCGDSSLLYPGVDGPNIGMRMEAQRRGAEDAALWQLLREKDEQTVR